MAARKKTQTQESKQNAAQVEQTSEESKQTAAPAEQTSEEPEQTAAPAEQTSEEPEQTTPTEQIGQAPEPTTAQEPEQDEFAKLPNPCVYCGPTVRGVARQYTTYMGGIPEPLKEFIREHPAARALIVSTARFANVRKRLETPGTAEAIVYKKVKSEL